jgi:hypothetical protein
LTAKDAISTQIEPLTGNITVGDIKAQLGVAIEHVGQLPIVDTSGHYIGMADASTLRAADGTMLSDAISAKRPITSASPIALLIERITSGEPVIAVVDNSIAPDYYVGAADRGSVLGMMSSLFSRHNDYTELTVTCRPGNYSASSIAHAVEDADANLLNLNVLTNDHSDESTKILLRVDHSRGESVARSLARYGYDTVEISDAQQGVLSAEMIERVNSLLHYLEL